jgi:hypothetical protein
MIDEAKAQDWGDWPQGHGQPCYYCGKPCNCLIGNPNAWPIPLCHADEPGVVKWHHTGCVAERCDRADLSPARVEGREDKVMGIGEHKWSRDGETCLECGDKDWMAGPVCRPKSIGEKHAACCEDAEQIKNATIEKCAQIVDGLVLTARPQCEANYTDGDSWLQTAAETIRSERKGI